MATSRTAHLTRRESEIMEVVYHMQEATAAEVLERVVDPPGYSAIRSALSVLEDKGLLRHKQAGQRYVYYPSASRATAARTALKRLLNTFFDGSPERAMAALLDMSPDTSNDERARVSRMITEAKREGR